MRVSAFKIFIITLIAVILGAFFIPKLSVRLNPTHKKPSITVQYNWAGASSYAVENKITAVLEAGFSTIKGLQNISSKSSKESGYITLTFDKYTNIDIARFETATLIRQLYNKLPKQTTYPTISVNKPDDDEATAFLSYAVNAPLTPFQIQEIVKNRIEPVIGAINSVDKTTVYGANPKEYVFTFNNDLLLSLGLTKNDLINALKTAFKKTELGRVFYNDNYISISVNPTATLKNQHIPVKQIEERIIYLDQLTTVKEVEQEAKSYYRINGKNAITLSIYATKNANTITLAKTIDKKLKELQKKLPQDLTIVKTYDSTQYLKSELQKIYNRTIYTVIILLVFILMVSKSIKYLLVTVLSLIANLGIAFLLYYAFNVQIQLYSLAGITISLGLIIDNSIVMIDHIRHQNNKRVFIPILASTLTTIGALSVIYFLDEKYRLNLTDFALVIIINLGVSLLIALFLIPALLQKITLPLKKENSITSRLKNTFYKIYKKIILVQLKFKKLTILIIILAFGLPVFMLPQNLENNNTWYKKAYNLSIGSEWYKENLRPHLDKYLGGSLRLFSYYVFESAFYNKNEETKLYVTASMEKGATVHQMNEVFLQIENYLQGFSPVKQFTTQIFSGNYARMEITFKDNYKNGSFPYVLKSRLVRKALDFGGIQWNVFGVGQGFSTGGSMADPINFIVKAKGYNYDALNAWADTLKYALEKHPRIKKVTVRENSMWQKKPLYEYRFSLDKERLALFNVHPLKLINQLKNLTLSKYQDLSLNSSGKYLPVRFESQDAKKFDVWHIKHTPLDSLHKPVLLGDIATITKERQDENIYKENQEYIRIVEFQYTGAAKFGSKFLNKKLDELKTKLPIGFTFERSERQWFFGDDKNNNYFFLLLLVMGIIYFICAILFESFKQPFIILSVIPISFIGVFLTFYMFDFNFDQGGMASFVLLSGITVNASIFILNTFNNLKKQFRNHNTIDLYLQAFKQKIFPILLTVFSTIIGFIPFVKDGQNEVFWFALGVGTMGGLLFSLIGILFYLPVFTLKKNLANSF